MCGRYAASRNLDEIRVAFGTGEVEGHVLPASYNIAPTQETYIVDIVEEGRRLRTVRWGLVPAWAHDTAGAARLINARCETVAEKPSFRAAYAKRRCLVPMDGWYEWSGAGKQPWFLSSVTGISAVAGIYERWRPANADPADPGAVVHTMAILTTAANDDIAHVHDRMPVLVAPDDFSSWLDPATPAAELAHLLRPAPLGLVQAWRVARLVSAVRNNGPALIEPTDGPEDAPVAEQIGLWE